MRHALILAASLLILTATSHQTGAQSVTGFAPAYEAFGVPANPGGVGSMVYTPGDPVFDWPLIRLNGQPNVFQVYVKWNKSPGQIQNVRILLWALGTSEGARPVLGWHLNPSWLWANSVTGKAEWVGTNLGSVNGQYDWMQSPIGKYKLTVETDIYSPGGFMGMGAGTIVTTTDSVGPFQVTPSN